MNIKKNGSFKPNSYIICNTKIQNIFDITKISNQLFINN